LGTDAGGKGLPYDHFGERERADRDATAAGATLGTNTLNAGKGLSRQAVRWSPAIGLRSMHRSSRLNMRHFRPDSRLVLTIADGAWLSLSI
jgi:hypothetical protein